MEKSRVEKFIEENGIVFEGNMHEDEEPAEQFFIDLYETEDEETEETE